MPLQHTNPPGLSTATGYTHVVTASGGRTIYLSGQVPVNSAGEVVGQGDLAAQARQVYENIRIALASAGGAFADSSSRPHTSSTTTRIIAPPSARRACTAFGAKPAREHPRRRPGPRRPEFMIEVEVVAVVG